MYARTSDGLLMFTGEASDLRTGLSTQALDTRTINGEAVPTHGSHHAG